MRPDKGEPVTTPDTCAARPGHRSCHRPGHRPG